MIFKILLILIAVVTLIYLMLDWSIHVAMVKTSCDSYGWGNRRLFWKYFKHYDLKRDDMFKDSYFGTNYNSKFLILLIILLLLLNYVKIGK